MTSPRLDLHRFFWTLVFILGFGHAALYDLSFLVWHLGFSAIFLIWFASELRTFLQDSFPFLWHCNLRISSYYLFQQAFKVLLHNPILPSNYRRHHRFPHRIDPHQNDVAGLRAEIWPWVHFACLIFPWGAWSISFWSAALLSPARPTSYYHLLRTLPAPPLPS